jgi:hypothetical protein
MFDPDQGRMAHLCAYVPAVVSHCVEKLRRVTQEYGFNEMLCRTRIGGLETRKVLRAMELMSGEVMPRLRNEMKEAA